MPAFLPRRCGGGLATIRALRAARILLPSRMAGRRSPSAGALADAPNNGDRLGAVLSRTAAIGEATIGTEIELKLAARAGDLPVLERALAARAAGSLGRPAELVSVYFDTPDHALARQGLTLRVRERDGHFVQTVKSGPAGLGNGGALARGEWEDAIGSASPDPQAAESGPVLAGDVARRLTPVVRPRG